MKHIIKQEEPKAFSDWKALANEDWTPTFDDLAGETKNAVKTALMSEQGYICCYCERRINDDDSHIEHFQPRHDPEVDPLDFRNLLCSCQSQLKHVEPRHCGHLKGCWFDHDLLVSPLTAECENRFAFRGDGCIKPAVEADNAAAQTIQRLGLDIPKLRALRAKAIEPFLDNSLSEEEIHVFVSGYLNRDDSDRFGEFWTAIRYMFGGLAAA